jgi:hypothetical protein
MISIDPPALAPETIGALNQANRVLDDLADLIPDSFGDDLRCALAMTFSSIAYEHAQSILFLSSHRGFFGSAMALFRPLLETIIRGEWLYFCASDENCIEFANDQLHLDSNPFKRMSVDLDTKFGVPRFDTYKPFFSKMCDYTHTGHDAVSRRSYPYSEPSPDYIEAQIRSLLDQSCLALVMHFEMICDAIGDQDAFEKLSKLFESIKLEQ